MRSQDDVCKEISKATDEERGDLIRRVRGFADWSDEKKENVTKFIMLLGLAGGISKRQ